MFQSLAQGLAKGHGSVQFPCVTFAAYHRLME